MRVSLCLPIEGRSLEAEPVGRWGAEHEGGFWSRPFYRRTTGAAEIGAGGSIEAGIFSIKIYKKLLTNSKLYDIIKNRDRHIPINSISYRYIY